MLTYVNVYAGIITHEFYGIYPSNRGIELTIYFVVSAVLLLFLIGLFCFSLYHYLDAKKENKKEPSAILTEKIQKHKRRMILLPFIGLLLLYALWATWVYGMGMRFFENAIYNVLIYAIPVFMAVLFFIFRHRYQSARKKNREVPGSIPEEEVKTRRILKNLFGAIALVLMLVTGGMIGLLFMAIVYM